MSEVNSQRNKYPETDPIASSRDGRRAPQANPNTPVQQGYTQSPAYQIPIAIPTNMVAGNPNYGNYAGSPNNYNTKQKHTNKLLIVGIIILALALISLAVAMLFVFKPFGLFEEEVNASAPSISEVETMFTESSFEEDMLKSFKYVNTEDMEDPSFKNTKVGEVMRSEAGNKDIYCEASSDVELRNNSITATTSLTMRMTYDKNSSTWKSSGVQTGNISGTPEGPADVAAIQNDILSLLRSYDSSVAAQFAGSEITNTSSLTKDGGQASFTLTKAGENGEEAKTCTVNTNVSWDDSRGWKVEITSVDGLEEQAAPQEEAPAEEPAPTTDQSSGTQTPSSSGGSGGGGSSSGQPTMLLVCYSGDLVQVPGVIEFEDSHVLLKTDHVIRVEFDNRVFITTYFELTGNGNWYRGEHTTVIGEISATGSLDKAPLVINVDYV